MIRKNYQAFRLPASWVVMSLFMLTITYSSCYYDVEEELYDPKCDSLDVTYMGTIRGIVFSYCQNCHNTGVESGGVILDTYEGIRAVVDDGRLLSAVKRDVVASPMPPPPSTRISDCAIEQIEVWIRRGAPKN